jgi:hypothetical protein
MKEINDLTKEEKELLNELLNQEKYNNLMNRLIDFIVGYQLTYTTLESLKKYFEDTFYLMDNLAFKYNLKENNNDTK